MVLASLVGSLSSTASAVEALVDGVQDAGLAVELRSIVERLEAAAKALDGEVDDDAFVPLPPRPRSFSAPKKTPQWLRRAARRWSEPKAPEQQVTPLSFDEEDDDDTMITALSTNKPVVEDEKDAEEPAWAVWSENPEKKKVVIPPAFSESRRLSWASRRTVPKSNLYFDTPRLNFVFSDSRVVRSKLIILVETKKI